MSSWAWIVTILVLAVLFHDDIGDALDSYIPHRRRRASVDQSLTYREGLERLADWHEPSTRQYARAVLGWPAKGHPPGFTDE